MRLLILVPEVREQLQEAVALIDGNEEAEAISPIHDHLREMLLLRRFIISPKRLSGADEGKPRSQL